MVANNLWEVPSKENKLNYAPDFWRYTPCDGKVPINPLTGTTADNTDWQERPYELEKVLAWNPPSIGLMLGPVSQIVAIDLDGLGSDETFRHHFGFGIEDLPSTIAWSSGRPHRHQRVYRVPESWWTLVDFEELKHGDNGKCEIRWSGQSVVSGKHPNKDGDGQGFYDFLPGCSPDEIELAEAPQFFLEKWAEISKPPPRPEPTCYRVTKADLIDDLRRAREYLFKYFQPANEYSDYWTWLNFGMELHDLSTSCQDAWKLFDRWCEWCSDMSNYDHEECERKWHSFGKKNRNTRKFASFIYRAQQLPNYDGPKRPDPLEQEKTRTYTELREAIYQALITQNSDAYFAEMAEMANRFRRFEKDIRPELLDLLRRKQTHKTYTVGECDISQVDDLEYLLEGFLPAGEIVHLYAPWGCGKTSLALGMIRALAMGQGFLDQERRREPIKSLFIQSDATASRYKAAYTELGLEDDPRLRTGPEQMLHLWAPDAKQGLKGWKADLWGLMKLMEEVPRLGVKAIFIDSVKGMMSGTGFHYADNEQVNQMCSLLRETIALPLGVCVVLLNHKGKELGEGAGAKAWSESAGQTIELKDVKGPGGEDDPTKRRMIIGKDSIGGRRSFYYTLKDGQHELVNPADRIKDGRDIVRETIRKLHEELGATQITRTELLKIDGLSRTSIDRAKDDFLKPHGCLKKISRGVYGIRVKNL